MPGCPSPAAALAPLVPAEAWRLADGARFSPSSAAFTLYMVTTIEIYNVKLVSEAPISALRAGSARVCCLAAVGCAAVETSQWCCEEVSPRIYSLIHSLLPRELKCLS